MVNLTASCELLVQAKGDKDNKIKSFREAPCPHQLRCHAMSMPGDFARLLLTILVLYVRCPMQISTTIALTAM